jgi:ABC-type transport system substrate-binding protein
MRILSGKAEVAPNAFSPTLLAGFRKEQVTVSARPGANVTYLLANGERAPFDRAEVRRALSKAIDRNLITKQLLSSYAYPAKWLLPEGHWAAPKDLPELAYEPRLASARLSGLPRVTLLTSTDRSRLLQARAIAQMLTDAGLQTDVIPLELGLLIARLDGGQFSLAILQIPELTEPNILRWFFHPRGIDDPNEGRNRARYRSDVAAALLDRGSRALEREARRQIYFDLARVMLKDMPVVPLWHEAQVVVVRDRAKRFLPSAEGRWAQLAEL